MPTEFMTPRDVFYATGTGSVGRTLGASRWTHQLFTEGGSATVVVEGTNDPDGASGWVPICTLTASNSSPASQDATHTWIFLRRRCTAYSATKATYAGSGGEVAVTNLPASVSGAGISSAQALTGSLTGAAHQEIRVVSDGPAVGQRVRWWKPGTAPGFWGYDISPTDRFTG